MLVYTLFHPVARIALDWYYRSVDIAGLERIPRSGPVFLAGNHPNALMDALVIGVLVPRRVRFLAKATLFANPFMGALLRSAGVIPLHRARDTAATGEVDPARNAQAFRAVADALSAGSAVVIFPEGISHDEPRLAPLRTGLARMALDARDLHGVSGVTIVPLGLVFEHKELPRTRVLLQVGEPLALDAVRGDDASVAGLTAEIERRLHDVTLNFASPEEATRVMTLAHGLVSLFAPAPRIGADAHTLADIVHLVRRIREAAARLTGGTLPPREETTASEDGVPARLRRFEQRFDALRAMLAHERLAPEDLAIDVGTRAGARFAVREGLLMLVRGPVGLWGRLNHWIPLTLTRRLALRGVQSRDEPAMRSVVLGLVLVLAFYALQTGLVAWLAGGWWAAAYALTLVPSANHDLRYGDRTKRARARMRAYFRFRRDPALRATLEREAEWLRTEAEALETLEALGQERG